MMGIRPSEKMSFIASMSLMVRVVRVPMGVLSNCERLSPRTLFVDVYPQIADHRLAEPGGDKGEIKAGHCLDQQQHDLPHRHPDDGRYDLIL